MLLLSHRARHLAVGLALVGGAWACAQAARAADGPAQAAPAETASDLAQLPTATAEELPLDMPRLLAGVGEGAVHDTVWRLVPNPVNSKVKNPKEQVVVVVPVRIAGRKAFKSSSPPAGPASGRFVAWYIPPAEEAGAAADKASQVPPGAPRLAASLAVTADGRIHWGVDRFSSTMELNPGASLTDENTFYLISLDRKRLKALALSPFRAEAPYRRPARIKGEPAEAYAERESTDRAAYDKRVEAARKDYDARAAQYHAAQDKLGGLPDKFSAKAPAVVYAVYYAPAPVKVDPAFAKYATTKAEDVVYGPYAEGPWRTPASVWAVLTVLAGGSGAVPTPEARAALEVQAKLLGPQVESKHPAALQAAAVALVRSGLLNDLTAHDIPFNLASKIIAGPDAWARNQVMQGLIAANVSSGKAVLLAQAVQVADRSGESFGNAAAAGSAGGQVTLNDLRLSSLRVLLHAREMDTDAKRIAATVQALADTHGPVPEAAFGELLKALEGEGEVIDKDHPPMALERAKAGALLFKPLEITDAKRHAQTLAAVLAASGKSVFAAVLVDECLLGSDSRLTAETLDIMAGMVAPKAKACVPLYAADHHLTGLLLSHDAAMRAAAWKVLPLCQVKPLFVAPANSGIPGPPSANPVFGKLAEGVVGLKPVPSEWAPFLARHVNAAGTGTEARAALARLLMDGDDAASKQAAELFAGAELAPAFAEVVASFPPESRMKAVAHRYTAKGLAMPAPVGVLIAPKVSDALLQWFGAQLATGSLPSAIGIAGQVPPEAPLFEWVLAQDPALARGAVAVLAYREGADDALADAAVTRMLSKPYKIKGQMEREWGECQADIFMGLVKKSQGDYAVRMAVYARGDKAWREAVAGPAVLKWADGAMGLAAGVSLTAAPEKKVLTLADVALLDRVNVKTRRELGLDGLSGAVDFKWVPPCWVAELHPDDDHVALLHLAPVGWKKNLEIPVLPAVKK